MPARAAAPKWRIPRRTKLFILRMRLLPQSEIAHRFLVVLVGGYPSPGFEARAVEVRESAVPGEARDAEVHVTVGDVSVVLLDEGRDHVDHLGDVLGCSRVVLGAFEPERVHVLEERR